MSQGSVFAKSVLHRHKADGGRQLYPGICSFQTGVKPVGAGLQKRAMPVALHTRQQPIHFCTAQYRWQLLRSFAEGDHVNNSSQRIRPGDSA